MAHDLNQCNFIGRLGQDPEIRYMPNGDAVASISLACGWKSKDKEGVEWIRCVAFKKLAEVCGQYLLKGSKIFVSGRFRTRKWQDQSGNDHYSSEIVIERMQMLDSKPDNEGRNGAQNYARAAHREGSPENPVRGEEQQSAGDSFFDDDIPFMYIGKDLSLCS